MIDNIIVALSNILFLFPIVQAGRHVDYLTMISIFIVAFASFTSQLVENHKHHMSGIPYVSEDISRWFNWFDRVGVAIVSTRFAWLYLQNDFYIPNNEYLIILVTIVLGAIGQFQLPIEYKWKHYIPVHSIWHVLVARQMHMVLKLIYE